MAKTVSLPRCVVPLSIAEWEKRSQKIWPDFYAAAGGRALVDKVQEIRKAP